MKTRPVVTLLWELQKRYAPAMQLYEYKIYLIDVNHTHLYKYIIGIVHALLLDRRSAWQALQNAFS